jgi:hypothetical protein
VSTWKLELLACPRCGARVEAKVVRAVAAGRAPAWRQAVLDGGLHRPRCGGCDAVVAIEAQFLYDDQPRGEWVMVAPTAALDAWAAHEREAMATFARVMAATDASPRPSRVRVVFGVPELREKVAAWDAGLDDRQLECAKLVVLRERPAVRGPGERMRWLDLAADPLVLGVGAATAAAPVRATLAVPRAWVAQIALDAWRPSCPELFADGFVSIDRYLRAEAA